MPSPDQNQPGRLRGLMNRRTALTTGGIALLAGWAGRDQILDCFSEPTDANQILLDFPDAKEIPGAAYVCRVRHRGAKLLFCHVRQSHWYSGMTEEERPRIAASQADIEKIISHAMGDERFHFQELLDEGRADTALGQLSRSVSSQAKALNTNLTKLEVDGLALDLRQHEDLLSIYEREKEITDPSDLPALEEKMEECRKGIQKAKEGLRKIAKELQEQIAKDKEWLELHAVDRLEKDKGLKVVGAETVKSNIHASEIAETADYATHSKVVMENREDIALKIAAIRGLDVSWCLYGAAHNFRDAIRRWNKKNPDKMFSLLEITPEANSEDEQYARWSGRSFFDP